MGKFTRIRREDPTISSQEPPRPPDAVSEENALPPILAARAQRGLPVWKQPYSLHWTSIRCWPGGAVDAWDDALSLGYWDEAQTWRELRVPGTTDPGDVVLHGYHPGLVCPGHHSLCWTLGVIHQDDPAHRRPAFVQIPGKPILFWPVLHRDQVGPETRVVPGVYGIDGHGSYGRRKVGGNSQLCQVTYDPADIGRFIEMYKTCTPHQGSRFSLTLIEEPKGSPLLLPVDTRT